MADGGAKEQLGPKRQKTRAGLMRAAFAEMTSLGIDATTIRGIAERAGVASGTFYNYFDSRDDVASRVLDCIISDIALRSRDATDDLRESRPELVVAVSTRLFLRQTLENPMWRWWVLRPDILATRIRLGLGPYATRDMLDAVAAGVLDLRALDVPFRWGIASWMMVGGLRSMIGGEPERDAEAMTVQAIMQMVGLADAASRNAAAMRLPHPAPPSIDWDFELIS